MSRGEGELHIVCPPFFHRSIVIMSKRGGNRRRRGTVRDYTDVELVSAAGGLLAGEGKLYAIDQWCFFSLGGTVYQTCAHTHTDEKCFLMLSVPLVLFWRVLHFCFLTKCVLDLNLHL